MNTGVLPDGDYRTQSGGITLIQRFGHSGVPAALNLNLHFHMLYLNGVYDHKGYFWPVKPLTPGDLCEITHKNYRRRTLTVLSF